MSDQQYQTLIMNETGTASDPVVTANIASWWLVHTSRGKTGFLAYLYTKQSVLRYILGLSRRARDIVIGPNQIRANQWFKNSLDELKDWNDFIKQNDTKQGVPVMETFTPRQRDSELDVVQDALDFAKQANPVMDELILNYVGGGVGFGSWTW